MTLATSLVVLFNCYATADILMKLLQQIKKNKKHYASCFSLLLLLYLVNSQMSVYRTIGPTLVVSLAPTWFHADLGTNLLCIGKYHVA